MTEPVEPVVTLPEPVRLRVIALAADALGALPAAEVPAGLKRVAAFAPRQRARLGASAIAAALDSDTMLRQRVAEQAARGQEDLAAALTAGTESPVPDPVYAAALAYLLRAPAWPQLVTAAGDLARRSAEEADNTRAAREVRRLQDQLDAARAQARAARERWRVEQDRLKTENQALRHRLQDARERARRAEQQAVHAADAAAETISRAEAARVAAEAEARRLRGRVAEAEATIDSLRRAERAGRNLGSSRLRLLLDSLGEATAGLRRELALPPADVRPADTVGGLPPGEPDVAAAGRLLAEDDPALLDELLALPLVHLVVDGYNVTKQQWGSSSLETQRARLVHALGALVARTGAEVTVVFDGAELAGRPAVPGARGVRVYFSPPGVTADEVIRQLVRAEPPGRAVVVVSSDREVAEGVRRPGVRPVAAQALLRLLSR